VSQNAASLISAHDLASTLTWLGEFAQARDLYRDTVDRRRRVRGEDHPDTLTSVGELARLDEG
jgi:hypothetical protein